MTEGLLLYQPRPKKGGGQRSGGGGGKSVNQWELIVEIKLLVQRAQYILFFHILSQIFQLNTFFI